MSREKVQCHDTPSRHEFNIFLTLLSFIRYPKYLTNRLKDLLRKLLTVDPMERIGSLDAIKSAPFFFEIKCWSDVDKKCLKPPFIPGTPEGMR
jgi:serine/threonine protein kinase